MKKHAIRARLLVLAWIVICGLQSSAAQVYSSDSGRVTFVSRAPLLEFEGNSDHLNGVIDLQRGTLDFYVDLFTLDTGNRRRDRDMRQIYLETEIYPFAEFTGSWHSDFNPALPGERPAEARGSFTMRGITRELVVHGTLEMTPEGLRIKAAWEIALEDYQIDRPRVVFYELSDIQQVSIDITLSLSED